MLRLYFTVRCCSRIVLLFENSLVSLPPQYRRGRLWAYLPQMLSDEMVLERPIAPEEIYGQSVLQFLCVMVLTIPQLHSSN